MNINPKCEQCQLCEDSPYVCVGGVGPKDAKVMIVGEAQGLMEMGDLNPIQGKAYKLLELTLKAAGIKKDTVYITNAVKCRPIGGKAPSKSDIKACLPYLAQEIEQVQPKVIITLGNSALLAVTGHSGITKWRGEDCVSKIMGIKTIPTFHPSAVLRSPKYVNQFKVDLNMASRRLHGEGSIKYEPVIHHVLNKKSLQALLRHLNNEIAYGVCDTETATFEYWHPLTKVATIGLCVDGKNAWAIPLEHKDSPWKGKSHLIIKYLKPYLEKIVWVGNNWKYDYKWMKAKYGVEVNFGPDNMLLSYGNDENAPHGLKYQAEIHCKAPKYDNISWPKYDLVRDDMQGIIDKYDEINLTNLLTYQALDVFYGWHIYPEEKKEILRDIRTARLYKHLHEAGSKTFSLIEMQGMWFDRPKMAEATRISYDNVDKVKHDFLALIPEGWSESNLNKKQLKTGFNMNSTQQVGRLFFQEDGFNLPVLSKTEKGAPSTAESVMIELGVDNEHPALELLIEYRKWAKYLSTYLIPWLSKLDNNDRLHPSFKLHGTVTGRLSGEDGVHQVPRDSFIRGLIGAPPGWTFLESDYSQIELRIVAAIANEETMLTVFATGGDIHTMTAAKVSGKIPEDITGDERKKAKAVNFGFVYGMGWRTFRKYAWEKFGVRLTEKQAQQFRKRFFEAYPGLVTWHARMRKLVRKIGYVVSPIGLKRRLPNIYSTDSQMAAAAEREAINSPVQGTGSHINLAALNDIVLRVIPSIDPNFETIKPVGMVHDAQYYEIRNDKVEFWAKIIKAEMEDITRMKKWFGWDVPVPIIADLKVGNYWGDAKDWEIGEPLPFKQR